MRVPRISASSYSNTAPLVWSFLYGSQRGRVELIMDNAPARSAELLAQNGVEAALVPVIEYQRIADVLLVPEVCVGARERVRSVCLVTKGADLCDVRTVALDISSRTSVALTKIIFREFLGFEPAWKVARPNLSEMLTNADCALLIGDPALMIADSGDSKFKVQSSKFKVHLRKFDLVELWREFTACGFVFAMWMAHRRNAEIARNIDFARARDESLKHIDEIIANYETEISLPREDFKHYLTENITYSINENMQKGLQLYHQLAFKNGLIEKLKPLEFIL